MSGSLVPGQRSAQDPQRAAGYAVRAMGRGSRPQAGLSSVMWLTIKGRRMRLSVGEDGRERLESMEGDG